MLLVLMYYLETVLQRHFSDNNALVYYFFHIVKGQQQNTI